MKIFLPKVKCVKTEHLSNFLNNILIIFFASVILDFLCNKDGILSAFLSDKPCFYRLEYPYH
jgi:hypothetical protein